MSKRRVFILGARPNLVKAASVYHALCARNQPPTLLYTGQHSSETMMGSFKALFRLPDGVQIGFSPTANAREHYISDLSALIQVELKKLQAEQVVVFGDVNSSYAGALAAHQLGVTLIHVEAGLRSFDQNMPEELNRIGIDQLADYFFTTEPSATGHLLREGALAHRIFQCGNTMIDALYWYLPKAKRAKTLLAPPFLWFSLHRPSNSDTLEAAQRTVSWVQALTRKGQVLWPMHPRIAERLRAFGLLDTLTCIDNLLITQPLDYQLNLAHMCAASVLVTDSGGVQEEAVVIGKKCITLRSTTERPITIACGSNMLLPDASEADLVTAVQRATLAVEPHQIPEGWDGMAGERIAEVLTV